MTNSSDRRPRGRLPRGPHGTAGLCWGGNLFHKTLPLVFVFLACPASAAPKVVTQGIQINLRDSRAAWFDGNYDEAMRRAMEVIVEDPGNAEARELMRNAARAMRDAQVREVEEERQQLLQSAREIQARRTEDKEATLALKVREERDFQERLEEADRARPAWSSWARAYIAHGEWLEAYRLIFSVKDQFPKDDWPVLQLERLSRALEREQAELAKRPEWYREAVLGYQAFAEGKPQEATAFWTASLERAEAKGYANREAIETRMVEAMAKLGPAPATPKRPVKPSVAKTAVARAKPRPAAALASPTPVQAPALAEPPAPARSAEVESLYVAGLVQYGMGHVGEALRTWEKVLELDAKHPAARRAVERAKKEISGENNR